MNAHLQSPQLDHDLREVVEGIFESMLHLPLVTEHGSPEPAGESFKAIFEFNGGWSGLVVLSCENAQARYFASRFLALPEYELTDQIISDVLGEIVNMIAGNLKAVFAHDIRLTLARIKRGSAPLELHFQPVIQHESCFHAAEGSFRVAVIAFPCEPRKPWPRD